MTKTVSQLQRMTKDSLVNLAYEIGCGERQICTERRGPYRKDIIISAIVEKQKANGAAK